MSNEKLIDHWTEGSDKNFEDMLAIYNAKRYDWALYIGHLTLEKLFKALYIKKTGATDVPFIHNLIKLAMKCDLELTDEKAAVLNTINSFCIESRYADEKQEFYKQCTRKFAEEQIKVIKEQRQWLKNELVKSY